MQLRGWGLTRVSRIVIILLVVLHLGLGQILAFAPASTAGSTPRGPTQAVAALDAVVSLVMPFDASTHTSAILGEHGSPATLPEPASLPRRLSRAPPAA